LKLYQKIITSIVSGSAVGGLIYLIIIFSWVLSNGPGCTECPGQDDIQIVFNISILSDIDDRFPQIPNVIVNQLEKIGINVIINERTSNDNLDLRTYRNPDFGSLEGIEPFDLGGFDILLREKTHLLEWNPLLFSDSMIQFSSFNIYQFENSQYQASLNDLISSNNISEYREKMLELQEILYLNLPSIPIFESQAIYLHRNQVSSINWTLLSINEFQSENWEDDDLSLVYATPERLNKYNCFGSPLSLDDKWIKCIYGSLYRVSNKSSLYEPYIAQNYTISEDRKEILVTINPNATFSSGDPVLAEDIVYSYHLFLDRDVNPFSSDFLNFYLNSSNPIREIDNSTIEFNFLEPTFLPEKVLTFEIIDKSLVEPLVSTYNYTIFDEIPFSGSVGDALITSCGPFKVDSFNYNTNEVVLVQNQFWQNNNTKLNQIKFEFIGDFNSALSKINSAEVDVLDCTYPIFNALDFLDPEVQLAFSKPTKIYEMIINMKHPVLGTGELTPVGDYTASNNIRKAIAHAIPRYELVADFTGGYGDAATLPYTSITLGFNEQWLVYVYDLDLAIEYMKESGFRVLEECSVTCWDGSPLGLPLFACYLIYRKTKKFVYNKKKREK